MVDIKKINGHGIEDTVAREKINEIGTTLWIAKNKSINLASGTSFDTNTLASTTLSKGVWIIEANLQVPALGATDKFAGLMIRNGTDAYQEESYLHCYAQYISVSGAIRLPITSIINIEDETESVSFLAFQNSGSAKTGSFWAKAVKII